MNSAWERICCGAPSDLGMLVSRWNLDPLLLPILPSLVDASARDLSPLKGQQLAGLLMWALFDREERGEPAWSRS